MVVISLDSMKEPLRYKEDNVTNFYPKTLYLSAIDALYI